jgi:hypothetical protein
MIALLAKASVLVAASTSYCPGSSGAYMADHHKHVYWGAAASNRHPFGTRIRLIGASFHGRHLFTIHDRIGHGSELDLWAPSCAWSWAWGSRRVRYRVVG